MNRAVHALTFALLAVAVTASAASAEVRLTIKDGQVSLIAKDATVRQILTEWARVGQTRVVNIERLTGGPLTLQLTDMSEERALDVLLRSASGYMLAPRLARASNLSRFDRIIVMPPSVGPRAASAPMQPSPFQPPQFAQPVVGPGATGFPGGAPVQGDDDEAGQPPTITGPANRPPVFNFPQPQVTPSLPPAAAPAAPSAYPSSPFGGVAVPGMVPAPQSSQPGGVPAQPNAPEGQ